ncbi:MAG: hypothetical protein CVV64_13575 [Candidatus Wallbacteria bacterium HGW-Wallbacteria-1]|uniref:TNase-like domain-containing protein n=1 Tax=Candidatus Wallbacteria bacterium HGW-Wallbacteria-1 TaxID=2013854 RepID=A0A2N1PMQ9_9BACT|nr:MAG: hypothetical protein CVV64_13575 [Candidatus Wallbacteria bacterium HGW-Wallbacteria-1]
MIMDNTLDRLLVKSGIGFLISGFLIAAVPSINLVNAAGKAFGASATGITAEVMGAAGARGAERSIKYDGAIEKARLLRVVDGDTLRVLYRGSEIKIRLIGVDTPESYPGGKADRDARIHGSTVASELALGRKAKGFLAGMLKRVKEVGLCFGEENRDKYSRYLCYVFLPDGRCVNEELIRGGMARVLMIPPNDVHRYEYLALYREAVDLGRGLWKDDQADGKAGAGISGGYKKSSRRKK